MNTLPIGTAVVILNGSYDEEHDGKIGVIFDVEVLEDGSTLYDVEVDNNDLTYVWQANLTPVQGLTLQQATEKIEKGVGY